MSGPTFRKWLTGHFYDVLKCIAIIVGYALIHLTIVAMFYFGGWLESKLHANPEHPPSQPPIIIVVPEKVVEKVPNISEAPKTKSRANHRKRIKKSCTK